MPAIRIDLSVRSWEFVRSIGILYLCGFGQSGAFFARMVSQAPLI